MYKDESVQIKKIVIDLGDKEITMDIVKARKLHETLSELFKEKVIHEHHYDHSWWWRPASGYYSGTGILSGGYARTVNATSVATMKGENLTLTI